MLQKLIADGKTAQALALLRQQNLSDSDLNAQINLLSARFATNQKQKNMGLANDSDLQTELNKINMALLDIINRLDNIESISGSKVALQPHINQGFSWTKWTGLNDVKSWIAAFAGLATLLTFYFNRCKHDTNVNDGKPFSVVIYTHGKGGKQDIMQLKETKLVADFGGRREVSMVGENNQNIFAEIPPSFFNKKIGIGLQGTEGYVLTHPDSTYQLNGEPIYVAVQSSCRFCNITGIIRNQKAFVANAIVSTGRFSDTTDANGLFDITIPPENELSEYPVTVRLNNKIVWDKYITPNPKQPAEILINN